MELLDRLFRKFEVRDALSGAEKAVLRASVARIETYAPGEALAREGELQHFSRILLDGMAARAKTLPDGGRAITELHVGGDFVDLHSFLLKRLEHDVVALTPAKVAAVPHERLRAITESEPHLTRLLWLSTLMDAAIHREWLASAGRRSAAQQLAHLVCELLVRCEAVGLSDGRSLSLPLTQAQISDLCGLSAVHVNRVVKALRATGLVEWPRSGDIEVRDREGLAEFAGFNPDYLVLDSSPR